MVVIPLQRFGKDNVIAQTVNGETMESGRLISMIAVFVLVAATAGGVLAHVRQVFHEGQTCYRFCSAH
jgi:hypothetical protein